MDIQRSVEEPPRLTRWFTINDSLVEIVRDHISSNNIVSASVNDDVLGWWKQVRSAVI